MLAQLLGERPRHAVEAELADRAVHAPLRAGERGHSAEGDDRAAAGLDHVRNAGLDAVKRAVERDREQAPPFVEAHVEERRLLAHRGVQHQEVQAPEAFHHAVDHGIDRFRVDDVGLVRFGLAARRADLLHDLVRVVLRRARVDRDCGAARRERERDRAADVARGAGDERHLAGELASRFVCHNVKLRLFVGWVRKDSGFCRQPLFRLTFTEGTRQKDRNAWIVGRGSIATSWSFYLQVV
ncbi:hypothetical protein D3C83_03440 [compost metagenome]